MDIFRGELWASGHDECVEVNQRALIDKILARYSGEFTVFRELLQNSDDVQSSEVEIRFETQGYLDKRDGIRSEDGDGQGEPETLPDLKTALVSQWTFKNNGMVFQEGDWTRLKKIAEGNPDEEKIGAFGVGFYSLFSVTEEPFVTSGGKWMGFYWKDSKDQLFARRGDLPDQGDSERDVWTTFEMDLRVAAPIPAIFDLTRFLASSITFMTHLSEVSIYFDDKRLTRLTKESGVPRELSFPGDQQRSSPLGIMNVACVKSTPLHIKVEIMQWSPLETSSRPSTSEHNVPSAVTTEEEDPLRVDQTSVSLSIISADVDVRLGKELAVELYRCTKKNAPSKLKCELTYTSKDDYDMNQKEGGRPFAAGNIFQGLQEDLDGAGSSRVFIGHATSQTTGLGGHIATRFIPTVERESIDLVDQNVAIWNKELLYIGGFLARSAYEMELADIRSLWEEATTTGSSGPDKALQSSLKCRCLHAMKFFTFRKSTPSAEVSTYLEAAFYDCVRNNQLLLISTAGVRNAPEVRIPDPACSAFLKQLPIIPAEVLEGAQPMIASLRTRGLIKAVTLEDILKELRSRPLTVDEVVAYLEWWVGLKKRGDNPGSSIRNELLNAAVLTLTEPGSAQEKVVPLASVKSFISGKGIGAFIPLDGPLPDHLLPVAVSSRVSASLLLSSFPWCDLTVTAWLRHVCDPAVGDADPRRDINLSAAWAERVITTLVRAWPSLVDTSSPAEIARILKNKTCIPTSTGLKVPGQSYLAKANIFHDLPIVIFPSGMPIKGPLEQLLLTLGVRDHVDLKMIFDRMVETGHWTIVDLTKYFVTIQSTLTPEEWGRLKVMTAFSKEPKPDDTSPVRYQAKYLYEPLGTFRQLGLPILDWGSQVKWLETSEEAKFLFELGLLRFPPLDILVKFCASPRPSVRSVALEYLLTHISTRYKDYDPENFAELRFIPALRDTISCLGTPNEVFSNVDWAALGFMVVHPSLQQGAQSTLKIRKHPLSSQLVSFLETTHPKDESEARVWFGILAGIDFSSTECRRLSQLPFVPAKFKESKGENDPPLRWLPPRHCFFDGGARSEVNSKLFVFVDFGMPANDFLRACGVKNEPSIEDVAKILLADPRRFYEVAGGPHNFLFELRKIAVNHKDLSPGTQGRMKRSPILLSWRHAAWRNGKMEAPSGDIGDDQLDLLYDLKRPDQIVIIDDMNTYQSFHDCLFAAPQERILEEFYAKLGSHRLTSLITEEYQTFGEITDSVSVNTRALILERLPLLLHELTYMQTKFSYSWLISDANLVVKTFRKISVTKTLKHGDVHSHRSHDTSAVAMRLPSGPIELCLRGNQSVDMYEVATLMCRLLSDAHQTNDALLFMTLLTSDLRSLKRKGYNVDRILNQQRHAAEDKAKVEITRLRSNSLPRTQLRNISSMIDLAIKASHEEEGNPTDKSKEIDTKLWLNKCSSDNSEKTEIVNFVRKIGSINIFVSEKIPEHQSFIAKKHGSFSRFTQIIIPLAQIYNIPLRNLNIYYSHAGNSAFNEKKSLFMNLKYFEEQHDEDVCNGTLNPAYVSWYFVLAHEIAHNLVQSHNLRHELYFSAICEKYSMELRDLLSCSPGMAKGKKSRKWYRFKHN